MNTAKLTYRAALLLAVTAFAGCGGGDSGTTAGIGGTGKIASGGITRFGSIFVNGVEYDIDSADCRVNGEDVSGACQSSLALGMVVTVEGSVSGTAGTASRVVFDADAQGPVASLVTDLDGLTRSFSILGVAVTVDKAGTLFDNSSPAFGFDTLAANNVVRVSGFVNRDGVLQATYIYKLADTAPVGTAVRLKGTAANVTGDGGPNDSFILNGVTVTIPADADLSAMPDGRVSDGAYVAVAGITSAAGVSAVRIEPENQTVGDDGDEVTIEGLVSGYSGDPASFLVAGRSVDAGSAGFEPPGLQLANDLRVEVEGDIVGETLVARRIEGRGEDIKIDATVSALTADTLRVVLGEDGAVTVNVNSQTLIEDGTGIVDNPVLSDLGSGDFVSIRGFQGSTGVTASEIRRGAPDDVILQGPVEAFVPGASITILGVTFATDSSTDFEDGDDSDIDGGGSAFYDALAAGDIVKIEDQQPADGIADEVDQED